MKLNKKGLAKGISALVLIVALATLVFSSIGVTGTEHVQQPECELFQDTCLGDSVIHPATFASVEALPPEWNVVGTFLTPAGFEFPCVQKCLGTTGQGGGLDCSADAPSAATCQTGLESICVRCNPSVEDCHDANDDGFGLICA